MSAVASLGILTKNPESRLNIQMAESFSHAMSSSVLLRWVVFEDEAAATSARGRRALEYWPQAILRRPSFVTRRQEWECVAKVRLARVRPPATHVVYPC